MRAHWELFVPIVLWISENMAHFDPFWLIEAHFCKFWPIQLIRGDTQNRDKMRVNLVVFFHFSQSWEFFAELKNSAKVQNRYPCVRTSGMSSTVKKGFNITILHFILPVSFGQCQSPRGHSWHQRGAPRPHTGTLPPPDPRLPGCKT